MTIKGANNRPYTVSFTATVFLVLAACIYLFSTLSDPAEVWNFFTMIAILTLGVVFAALLVGVNFIAFSWKNFVETSIATLVSAVSIYFVNQIVPTSLGVSPIGAMAYGILAGVSEEWFFRLFLCAWIFKVTNSAYIAIPISSFMWAWFHIYRYGGNPMLIVLIFVAGLPLGAVTLWFRSADGPTFGHSIINALQQFLKH